MCFFKNKKEPLSAVKKGILAGVGEVIFISLVSLFLAASQALFHAGSKSLIFGISASLLLLVLGVAVSGLLIFGYPAYYFLNKQHRAALVFLAGALGAMIVIFLLLVLGEIFVY